MSASEQSWPFDEPTNLAVISLRQIVFGGQPILHVTHDADDGGWQFLGLETPPESDAVVVSLKEITELDPSIKSLANLPIGWEAWRTSKNAVWEKLQKTS